MTDPTPLSPAAQAVLDAYMHNCGWLDGPLDRDYRCVAAVLRAAADQVVPDDCLDHQLNDSEWQTGFIDANCRIRAELLAIAAELEGAQ